MYVCMYIYIYIYIYILIESIHIHSYLRIYLSSENSVRITASVTQKQPCIAAEPRALKPLAKHVKQGPQELSFRVEG